MHTRKKSRQGGHPLPGHQYSGPAEWQLVLLLGVVLLSVEGAVALVLLLSSLSEKAQGLVLSEFTGDNAASAAACSATSNLYWAAKSAIARALQWEHPRAVRRAGGAMPPRQCSPSTAHCMSRSPRRSQWQLRGAARRNDGVVSHDAKQRP